MDDGSHWAETGTLESAVAPLLDVEPFDALDIDNLQYSKFLENSAELLEFENQATFLLDRFDLENEAEFQVGRYPFLAKPIDIVFQDIERSPARLLHDSFHRQVVGAKKTPSSFRFVIDWRSARSKSSLLSIPGGAL